MGRGFSLTELKVGFLTRRSVHPLTFQAAGIYRPLASTIGIAVDHRRANLSEEGLAANVQRLKDYKARLILFPRKSNKPKKGDTAKDQQSTETVRKIGSLLPAATAFSEIKKGDLPKGSEKGAYRTLRETRAEKRYLGAKEKRAKDKAEDEKAKK